jgi:stage II sporulation protein D
MPASYPLEALKAQAVCARTYAYRKMMNSGLPEYGAHLDDSTSFQVYNNIKENVETTKAVRETKGELLYAPSGLVDAYYYSTSCGFGTTAEIWKSGMPTPEYLQSKRIGSVGTDESLNENTMTNEEVFRSYIEKVHDSDYDSREGWYRWNYTVEEINSEAISLRMQTRQKANKNLILKQSNNDTYVIENVDSFTEIYHIECKGRGPGGVLDSIYLETDCGNYQVVGEYNIRYVLNDEKVKVCRQDGSEVVSPTLLPSAYFVMDIIKDGECVSGYTIQGGGFGHGVGMSQNGAKNMALAGMDSTQILTFFYDESSVKKIY